MAENPTLWGPATEVIDAAIETAHYLQQEGYCGYSTAAQIALALKDAGYLKEEDIWQK